MVLRTRLIDNYAEFYKGVAPAADPRWVAPSIHREMQLTFSPLLKVLPDRSRVLDLGCGSGILLNWLSQQGRIVAVGVDGSISQVAVARHCLPHVEIAHADGIDYARAHRREFGGIILSDVLEHIPGEDLALEWLEAIRVALIPGGFFYCRVPNAANLTAMHSRYMDLTHVRSFTSGSLLTLLQTAGFERCRIAPTKAADFSGRGRLLMEHLLHKAVFRICGKGSEVVFTKDVCAIGYNA